MRPWQPSAFANHSCKHRKRESASVLINLGLICASISGLIGAGLEVSIQSKLRALPQLANKTQLALVNLCIKDCTVRTRIGDFETRPIEPLHVSPYHDWNLDFPYTTLTAAKELLTPVKENTGTAIFALFLDQRTVPRNINVTLQNLSHQDQEIILHFSRNLSHVSKFGGQPFPATDKLTLSSGSYSLKVTDTSRNLTKTMQVKVDSRQLATVVLSLHSNWEMVVVQHGITEELSILYQCFQLTFLTIADLLLSIQGLKLWYFGSPKALRFWSAGVFFGAVSLGNLWTVILSSSLQFQNRAWLYFIYSAIGIIGILAYNLVAIWAHKCQIEYFAGTAHSISGNESTGSVYVYNSTAKPEQQPPKPVVALNEPNVKVRQPIPVLEITKCNAAVQSNPSNISDKTRDLDDLFPIPKIDSNRPKTATKMQSWDRSKEVKSIDHVRYSLNERPNWKV
ncbi:hypothetical protein Ciccas_002977 [Cichlidogyrus casuarinus]|uniref:Uncharacterized protein n=1 Tax=Cichlidogyrus casuarinus TaxID=1844966 RepID=A0ABD2QI01_9PLAT